MYQKGRRQVIMNIYEIFIKKLLVEKTIKTIITITF